MAIASAFTPVVPTANPTTGFSVTVPAGAVAGVILEIQVTSRDNLNPVLGPSISDDDTGGNAWAIVKQSADGKATTWWKRATSGTAGKTITIANCQGSASGVLFGFSGCVASGTPQTDIIEESNASANETHAGFTPSQTDSMVRAAIYNYNNDNAVTSLSFATLGALTTAEKLSTGGSDCGCIGGYKAQVGAAAATGTLTWAQTDGTTYSHTWALKPFETHSGTATLTSGGELTPVIATARNAAPTFSSGGGIAAAIATARNFAALLSSGGGITYSASTQRNKTALLSSGGGIAFAESTQRNVAPLLTGGGTITSSGVAEESGGPEEHAGSALLTSGGSVAAAITTARASAPVLTSGGSATLAVVTARQLTALFTTGGGIAVVVSTLRQLAASLTSGGVLAFVATTARALIALLTGGGAINATGESNIADSDREGFASLAGGGLITITYSKQITVRDISALTPAVASRGGILAILPSGALFSVSPQQAVLGSQNTTVLKG